MSEFTTKKKKNLHATVVGGGGGKDYNNIIHCRNEKQLYNTGAISCHLIIIAYCLQQPPKLNLRNALYGVNS